MSEDLEFQKRLINQISSAIEGMKNLNERITANVEALGRFDVEFTKLSRQNNQLRSDVLDVKSELGHFRVEASQRLNAIFSRLDEVENVVDSNSKYIRDLASENRSHYNDILTALQDGLHNNISIRELTERIEELERRSGM